MNAFRTVMLLVCASTIFVACEGGATIGSGVPGSGGSGSTSPGGGGTSSSSPGGSGSESPSPAATSTSVGVVVNARTRFVRTLGSRPQLAEDPDGTLRYTFAYHTGKTGSCTSSDGAKTWTCDRSVALSDRVWVVAATKLHFPSTP